MKRAEKKKLWHRIGHVFEGREFYKKILVSEIDRAVRKVRREERGEAITCVDCRETLLGEVRLCLDCINVRDRYGIDRNSRKRFDAEKARREEEA